MAASSPDLPIRQALPAAFTDASSLLTALVALQGHDGDCTALLDPSRFESIAQCAAAMGMEETAFAALPNLYGNFSPTLKAQGPRLFTAHLSDNKWSLICNEAVARQAASFIVHGEDAGELQAHLKSLIKLQQPDGSKLLFRFHDSVVLSALLPLLTPQQQRMLLGPARHWLVLDVCGKPEIIASASAGGLRPSSLMLSAQQLQALDVGLWPATIIAQADETESTLLQGKNKCQRWQVVRQAIARAQAHGLQFQEDVALYCVLSLQLPEDFDREGPVADALQRARNEDIGFGTAIDQVPTEQWRVLDEILER